MATETMTPTEAIDFLQANNGAITRVPKELHSNRDVLLAAVIASSGHAVKRVAPTALDIIDENFVITAVKGGANGWILKHLPASLRDNENVVMACVSADGSVLQDASPRLQNSDAIQKMASQEIANRSAAQKKRIEAAMQDR